MNVRAERLLGARAPRPGIPCHRVVASFDLAGRPCCGPRCPLFEAASAGREIPPRMLRVSRRGVDRWIQLLIIPTTAPDGTGPYLVHCVLDADEARRMRDYVARLASRTRRGPDRGPDAHSLTRRELEVLSRLERDESLWTIACDLHITHATVRNHVQNILGKLGVHSIAEAVAHSLLEPPGFRR
jgi:DNA-binding CsgD family transcriptional regulator